LQIKPLAIKITSTTFNKQSIAKYGKVWQSMAKYGKVWQSMAKYGTVWQSIAKYIVAKYSKV
jgi:hypothetical protein